MAVEQKETETTELFNRCSFVEVKAASDVYPINKAQLLGYMKLLDIRSD